VADVAARVPGARVLLQLDEPSLPTALAGRVPTESGWGTLRAVHRGTAVDALGAVVAAAGVPVVLHCCAPDAPLELFRTAGAAAVALNLDLVSDLDPLGEAIDAGLGLFAGAAPTRAPAGGAVSSADVADRVRGLWHKLGFPPARLPEQVVVTPACGLAGAEPAYARSVLAACRDAARRLRDDADG
jgi:methionine synthase II (cobalamin-independent)